MESGASQKDRPEHGEIVTRAACKHEEMPDHVAVGKTLPDIKDHTRRIKKSASYNPKQRDGGNVLDHRFGRDNYQPAHGDINRRREMLEMVDKPEFENDSRKRQPPNHTEK